MKKKFVLEFDEEPALVFVEPKFGSDSHTQLYQDGKLVHGWSRLNINTAAGEATKHEVEFLTGCTKDPEEKEKVNAVGNLKVTIDAKDLAENFFEEANAKIQAGLRKAQRHQ